MTGTIYFPNRDTIDEGVWHEGIPVHPTAWLEAHEGVAPFIRINLRLDSGEPWVLMFGTDITQPINSHAARAVVTLADTHIMVFGPALIEGVSQDDATAILGRL